MERVVSSVLQTNISISSWSCTLLEVPLKASISKKRCTIMYITVYISICIYVCKSIMMTSHKWHLSTVSRIEFSPWAWLITIFFHSTGLNWLSNTLYESRTSLNSLLDSFCILTAYHKNERRKGSTAILQQQQHNSYIHWTLQKSHNNNDNDNNNNDDDDDNDNDFPVMHWCEKQTDLALLFNHAISIPLEN